MGVQKVWAMNRWKRVLSWLGIGRRKKLWISCPQCGVDLGQSLTMFMYDRDGISNYECPCGTRSRWDFSGSVPVLVEFDATRAKTHG